MQEKLEKLNKSNSFFFWLQKVCVWFERNLFAWGWMVWAGGYFLHSSMACTINAHTRTHA